MKIKKMTAIILGIAMVSGSLAGCGKSADSKNQAVKEQGSQGKGSVNDVKMSANGEFPIVEEKQEFTIMVPQVGYILDIIDNDFTKWYEEQTNIHINWEIVPNEAVKEKFNIALTSGEYPDAFLACAISPADQVKYGGQGIFLSLNDFIEDYSVDFKAGMEASALLPEAINAPDGNIYALPQINECFHCFYPAKVYINQTWLDNVNMEYPETTEDFYQVLKAFKEQDANKNGEIGDEIPMMGAENGWYTDVYSFLLNSFVYWDGSTGYAKNGDKIEFVANTEEFRDGLRYISKLVKDGLIDPISFTQKEEQAKIIGGDPQTVKVGAVCGATFQSILGNPAQDPLKRYEEYVALSPLKGPKGIRNALTEEGGVYGGAFVITDRCKNPEVLFRWADAGYNRDITLRSQIGPEGIGWEKPEEGILGIDGKPALFQKIPWTSDTVQNYKLENQMLANRTLGFRNSEAVNAKDEFTLVTAEPRRYKDTKTYYEPYRSDMMVPPLMYTQEEADERAMIQTGLTDYMKESMMGFMVGNKDLDKDWDSYVKEFDSLNLPRILEITQTSYDRQYK